MEEQWLGNEQYQREQEPYGDHRVHPPVFDLREAVQLTEASKKGLRGTAHASVEEDSRRKETVWQQPAYRNR